MRTRIILTACLSPLAGCVVIAGSTCGVGTHEESGACVPDEPATEDDGGSAGGGGEGGDGDGGGDGGGDTGDGGGDSGGGDSGGGDSGGGDSGGGDSGGGDSGGGGSDEEPVRIEGSHYYFDFDSGDADMATSFLLSLSSRHDFDPVVMVVDNLEDDEIVFLLGKTSMTDDEDCRASQELSGEVESDGEFEASAAELWVPRNASGWFRWEQVIISGALDLESAELSSLSIEGYMDLEELAADSWDLSYLCTVVGSTCETCPSGEGTCFPASIEEVEVERIFDCDNTTE